MKEVNLTIGWKQLSSNWKFKLVNKQFFIDKPEIGFYWIKERERERERERKLDK
jgi:hypothetical protein